MKKVLVVLMIIALTILTGATVFLGVTIFQNKGEIDKLKQKAEAHEQENGEYKNKIDSMENKIVDIVELLVQDSEENKNEIIALRIIYDQAYKDRPMSIEYLKALYEKLQSKGITVERLWDSYAMKKPDKVKKGTLGQITDLIALIRFPIKVSIS